MFSGQGIWLMLMKESYYYNRNYLKHPKGKAEQYSPAHTVCRRESLIFDFHLTGHHYDT